MGRKPGSGRKPWVMAAGALASWLAAASLAQGLWGADIGRAVHQLDERIERFLDREACPAQGPEQPSPARSHEDDALEPWELVSV